MVRSIVDPITEELHLTSRFKTGNRAEDPRMLLASAVTAAPGIGPAHERSPHRNSTGTALLPLPLQSRTPPELHRNRPPALSDRRNPDGEESGRSGGR